MKNFNEMTKDEQLYELDRYFRTGKEQARTFIMSVKDTYRTYDEEREDLLNEMDRVADIASKTLDPCNAARLNGRLEALYEAVDEMEAHIEMELIKLQLILPNKEDEE